MNKSDTEINKLISELENLDFNMNGKDFLLSWDKSKDDIIAVLTLAQALDKMYKNNRDLVFFKSGMAVSYFRDMSTRTRMAFASACNMLGLEIFDMDESKSQVSHGETVRETANMLSFLSEVVGIRDDMFIGHGHKFMKEVASSLTEGFREKVLPRRPAVINLQCDMDHPTQTLADLQHIKNHFKGLNNIKGKKIAMSWAYSPSYGKPLSVPQGIISLMSRFGAEVFLAHPPGYELMPRVLSRAEEFAGLSGGSFKAGNDMKEAFRNADLVYPKSWAPFEVMKKRTGMIKNNRFDELKTLEKECLSENARHKDWVCDREMMALTGQKAALYMHCLPADVAGVNCADGEVTAEVFENYRIQTYIEAGHKPFIIAAMIMLCRFENPVELLKEKVLRKEKRVF